MGSIKAQDAIVGTEAHLMLPISSPQSEQYGVGGSFGLSLQLPVKDMLHVEFQLRAGFLSDGKPPFDLGLQDPGVGGVYSAGLGLQLFPFIKDPKSEDRGKPRAKAVGGWVDVHALLTMTGELFRPSWDVGLGWNFEWDSLDLGPSVRIQHIIHFDDPLESRSALLLMVGLEVAWLDGRSPPPSVQERRTLEDSNDWDKDGIPNDPDSCPREAEDFDQIEDQDGCPETDLDHDGIEDKDDKCMRDPEDQDQFEDEDGCPEIDNDRDGFLDVRDRCPNEAEVINGVEDEDGCPDEGVIQMINDRIILEDHVLFDTNRSRVKSQGRVILQAIVTLIKQHPEWKKMRIEGHSDRRGDPEWNRDLSRRRANSVRQYLIGRGISETFLEAEGLGADRVVDPADTEEAHQHNRRVEFVVVARTSDAAPVTQQGVSP